MQFTFRLELFMMPRLAWTHLEIHHKTLVTEKLKSIDYHTVLSVAYHFFRFYTISVCH